MKTRYCERAFEIDWTYTMAYSVPMGRDEAIRIIRECIDDDRVIVKEHFTERMQQRGMFWGDVLGIVEEPTDIRTDGRDPFGRERWFLAGEGPDGLLIELLCVIDDESPTTLFITIYWED